MALFSVSTGSDGVDSYRLFVGPKGDMTLRGITGVEWVQVQVAERGSDTLVLHTSTGTVFRMPFRMPYEDMVDEPLEGRWGVSRLFGLNVEEYDYEVDDGRLTMTYKTYK